MIVITNAFTGTKGFISVHNLLIIFLSYISDLYESYEQICKGVQTETV